MPWKFIIGTGDLSLVKDIIQLFSIDILLVTIAVALIGYYYFGSLSEWWWQRRKLVKLASQLPGPPCLPIVGNALFFAVNADDTLSKIVEAATYCDTPSRFWLGPKLFVILSEPRDYEVILGSQKASHKDSVYRFMEPFVGKGLVSGSGAKQRAHRKVIMPMFNSNTLSSYLEFFNSHSKICVQLLSSRVDKGEFDILPFMTNLTVDIVLETIVGVTGNAQKNEQKEFTYWVEKMYELVHVRMVKVWLHLNWIYSLTSHYKQQKAGQAVIHGFIDSVVKKKKDEYFEGQTSGRPKLTLAEQLIEHVMKTDLMDDKELRDEIYTIFTAAQDTTAVISSFLLLMLAMHQQVQDKVREELNEITNNEDLGEHDLSNLKYTDLVVRETVRLFPIAPLMVRQLTGDVELETCTLPKGCSVVMAPYVTHRSDKWWTEPEKFIPERFTMENSRDRHTFAYVPFSGGLRGCIGQKYAIMCLKTITAHVVRNYKLTTTMKLNELPLKTDISIRSANGYKISISPVVPS